MNFVKELHRRDVIKVAVTHIVTWWRVAIMEQDMEQRCEEECDLRGIVK